MIRLENVLKTSSKRLLEDVLKTSWRRLEDVWPRQVYWSWSRRLLDILKTSSEGVWVKRIYSSWWRRLLKTKTKDILIKMNVCWDKLSIDGVQIPHPMKGINFLFSGHVMSVKLNSITQSLLAWNIALLKELSSHRHVLRRIFTVFGSAFMMMTQFRPSCKHVFAILHYIENEVTLGHSRICTGKKQEWDVKS